MHGGASNLGFIGELAPLEIAVVLPVSHVSAGRPAGQGRMSYAQVHPVPKEILRLPCHGQVSG